MSDSRVLVAGIGNVFLGDDAFGVEVAQALLRRPQPKGVEVVDFGIRGFDLAYAMLDDHEVVILVDAMPRGTPPGTLNCIEADVDDAGPDPGHDTGAFSGHLMTPAAVFTLVRTLGGRPQRVLVVGCEPLTMGDENEGAMGLSEPVQAAVPEAVAMVEKLVAALLDGTVGDVLGAGAASATQEGIHA